MTEIRCKKCNRLLLRAVAVMGEIKCPKCRYSQDVFCLTPDGQELIINSVIKTVETVVNKN